MAAPPPDDVALVEDVNRLVDEHRISCLWFLRPDYDPATDAERIEVLTLIERHGDRHAFLRAATLRRCLSRTSSGASADS